MIHEIRIRPAANGFIVQVGCQTLVYARDNAEQTVSKLTQDLHQYLLDPDGTEKVFAPKMFNSKHLSGPEPAMVDRAPANSCARDYP